MKAIPNLDDLRSAVQLACQPQNVSRICAGRRQVLEMPRDWVLEKIEQVAQDAVNLSDYWEYRRLLELAELLDTGLLQRIAAWGLHSGDEDVQEAVEDYRAKPD
jgi:hypothetical protein